MIELLSQTEAERQGINPRRVQCITPYLNPAHVLSPPRIFQRQINSFQRKSL